MPDVPMQQMSGFNFRIWQNEAPNFPQIFKTGPLVTNLQSTYAERFVTMPQSTLDTTSAFTE